MTDNIFYQKELKYLIISLLFIISSFCKHNFLNKITKKKNEYGKNYLEGTFTIDSKSKENLFFSCKNDKLIISEKSDFFDIIKTEKNSYYIICKNSKKIVGVDKNQGNDVLLYSNLIDKQKNYIIWELLNIKENIYYFKSKYNDKYLISNKKNISLKKLDMNFLSDKPICNYEFRVLKFFEEKRNINSYQLKMVEDEPIDLFMKYIDLRDKNLKRDGIKQIYKDFDNEELRYSLRSIFEYIPWIRKIFIVMPNEKVRFLKSYEEIKDKIVYIKDKDFLGYDSANICAFTFNLYKMEKFGISKNFIYMEDDCFIGKPLKKSDFFYYDDIKKKVYPYIINTLFSEMDKTKILKKQKKMFKLKNSIKPHSFFGFIFSLINTDKYFIEKYNIPIISPKFTHCAIAFNLDDLREIYKEIQDYEYINETLFSKTRHVLTLNQQEFVNLYQLNIKHRKVHSINNSYIRMEKAKKNRLNIELFVLNTGGNHKPTKKEYTKLTNVMKQRFPNPTNFEIT